jgi:hypothetical protein
MAEDVSASTPAALPLGGNLSRRTGVVDADMLADGNAPKRNILKNAAKATWDR